MADVSQSGAPRLPPEVASPGAIQIAALLLGLGKDLAQEVFKHLSEYEVRQIALGARELRRNPGTRVLDSLRAYVDSMERMGGDAIAGDDVLRNAAIEALGHEAGRRAFDGVVPIQQQADDALGPIANADAEALAMVLAREQSQTIALVLSSLSPEKASAVMDYLPENARAQIVRRMATVDAVAPDVLREVRYALTQELQSVVAEGMRKVDGRAAALEVLRRSPSAQQAEVLAAIEADEPRLAAELRSKLFTFDDLVRLSDRDVQTLLRGVDMKDLVVALKGGDHGVKEKFVKNMSQRAGESLLEELGNMGPVKLSEVEAAQGNLARVAVELAEGGKITIVRPTDKLL